MADKKISALTGATTPLAGTEVLPIVQGGATKQVSVANLTAGRSVGMSALNVSGLTASTALALDASKNAVSVTNTGTGSNLLASNVNVISPNLLTYQDVNEKCYALTGWNFVVAFGGGSSMVMGTAAPTNFAPLSISVTASGVSYVYAYDATSAATIQSSCARASVSESFTASARMILNSGTGNVSGIQLDFYNSTGTLISSSARTTINSASFDLITATGTAPSLTAYVGIQLYAETGAFNFCDAKLYRN